MGKGGKAGRNPVALLRGGKTVDELFAELDADGGGTIERDELRTLLTQLGRPASNEELDRVMGIIDADRSGEIELNEFKTWWASETKTEETIEWTYDPVTGEEGYFDGNNVWITAGWVDEGGYYIEPAGEKNQHGRWCANGLLDCYAADGEYVETGRYVDDCWTKVEGEYDSEGRWAAAPPPALPGSTGGGEAAAGQPDGGERRRERKPEFSSLEDAYAKIAEKDSVVEMLATARRVNAELKRATESRRAMQRFNSMAPAAPEPRFARKPKGGEEEEEVELKGTVLEDGDRICIEEASGGGGYHDLPCALLFLVAVGGTFALAVLGMMPPPPPEDPLPCESSPCLNGATCTDVYNVTRRRGLQTNASYVAPPAPPPATNMDGIVGGGDTFGNTGGGTTVTFACSCPYGFTGERCGEIMAWLARPEDELSQEGAGSAAGLEEEAEEVVPLRPFGEGEVLPFVGMIAVSAVGAAGMSALWLMLLRRSPRGVIWGTLGAVVLAQVASGGVMIAGRNLFGVLIIVAAGFSVLLGVLLRHWVPLAASMIRLATDILQRNPMLVDVALATLALQLVWCAVWCTAASGLMRQENPPLHEPLFLVLSLFWFVQVAKNVAHLTVVGAAASWYFDTKEEAPVRASLKRALTSSFGSICLGSLVVALVKTLNYVSRFFAYQSRHNQHDNKNPAWVLTRSACAHLTGPFAKLIPIFNHYAFTHVAIYGISFTAASKASFNMVKESGLVPLISNSLLQAVIGLGVIACGAVACAAGVGVAQLTTVSEVLPTWAVALLSAALGMGVALPTVEAVQSIITAVFVCYARDPAYLQMRRPDVYAKVQAAADMMATDDDDGSGSDEYEYGDQEDRPEGDDEYEYEEEYSP